MVCNPTLTGVAPTVCYRTPAGVAHMVRNPSLAGVTIFGHRILAGVAPMVCHPTLTGIVPVVLVSPHVDVLFHCSGTFYCQTALHRTAFSLHNHSYADTLKVRVYRIAHILFDCTPFYTTPTASNMENLIE